MNVRAILNFYSKNALYDSKHDYLEKFSNLYWFCDYSPIKIQHVYNYCDFRRSSGVKNSTINREINIIRAAFTYYIKHHDDVSFKNVFLGFNLFEDDYLPRYLSEAECSLLLSSCASYSSDLHDYVLLLLNTGCRSGELLSLTWDNVFLDDGYFVVRNSLSKNKKTVIKPLTAESIAALRRLKRHDYFVFYNSLTGKNIRTFRRGWLWALDNSGIGHLRVHDLRHTFASFLVRSGVPIYHVSTLLGHSDTRITQRYAHLAPSYLKDCVGLLPTFEVLS